MHRRFLLCIISLAVALSLTAFVAGAYAQTGRGDAKQLAAAEALYDEAMKAMEAKDYATACPKLEEVVRLAPQGVGGRLSLAECYEDAGKLASAYTNYVLVETMAAQAKQPGRQQQAHGQATALKPKLATVTIVVAEGVRALAGLEVQRDGVVIESTQWGVAVPIDKGRHVVVATATGKRTWEKTIDVSSDGVAEMVTLDAMADARMAMAAPTAQPQPPPLQPPPVIVEKPAQRPDAPRAAVSSLSHRRQFGAVLRADIDGQGPGVIAALGLSYGIGDYVEVSACALIGPSKGVEPGATVLLLPGTLKPRISIGVPIFIVDGAWPGVHAGAGLQWDPIRHVGLFVEASVAAFPNAPVGYDKVVFVPVVGVQPRL